MMKLSLLILVASVSHAVGDSAQVQAEVTPIQKVLQMMAALRAKGVAQKDAETVEHTTFMQFCTNTDSSKVDAIANGQQKIDSLKANIEKFDSEAEVLTDEIKKLDNNLDEAQQSLETATRQRKAQHADYLTTRADYDESVGQMGEAMKTLGSMMEGVDAAGASSLVQSLAKKPKMPATAKKALVAFLSESTSADAAIAAPEGATYESQSGGISGVVDELQGKMEKERDELDKEETAQEGAFHLVKQQLTDNIALHTSHRQMKVGKLQETQQASATASGDLADTTASYNSDTKYLADLRTTCQQQSADFQARQKMREEELSAIDKATELIGGDSVAGSGTKHLPALLQKKQKGQKGMHALVQLRSAAVQEKNRQNEAAAYLAARGRKLNSSVLASIAAHASFDPFVKIRKMVRDMIQKLEDEGDAEATHKAWCDNELGTNKATRDEKTMLVEQLTAKVEQMTATSSQLKTDIADLSAEMANIDQAVSKATELRQAEKIKNNGTVKDAEAAVVAVQRALSVLQDFYAKAAKATSLSQVKSAKNSKKGVADDLPSKTYSKPYTGLGAEGGIVGMLEVILSDFERLLVETTGAETAAAQEFEKFSSDSAADKESKDRSVRHKTDEKMYLDVDLSEEEKDLASTQKELDAAVVYFAKLKPDCLAEGTSYADRVARRQEEIESLNEALKILVGDA